ASIVDGQGVVDLDAVVQPLGKTQIDGARLTVEHGDDTAACDLIFDPESGRLHGRLVVPQPDLWWPHTHGEPATYRARAIVRLRAAGTATQCAIDLGPIGFRTVSLDTTSDNFRIDVNGRRIFCRGACWTPLDIVALRSDREACATALEQVRDA